MAIKESNYVKYHRAIGCYNQYHVKDLCEAFFGDHFEKVVINDKELHFDIYLNEIVNKKEIDPIILAIFKDKLTCKGFIVHILRVI